MSTRPIIVVFDAQGSDRHIAAYAWSSTSKDEQAMTCDEAEVRRLLRALIKGKHASPFGHSHVTFKIDDVPLFVVHQIERHRSLNFSEKSHRYVEAGTPEEGPRFYLPDLEDVRSQVGAPMRYIYEPLDHEDGPRVWTAMKRAYVGAAARYEELLALGVAREQARMVLPSALLTRLYATASLRNWLNFLVLRADPHAQEEIRYCADVIAEHLARLFPITIELWNEHGRPQL